MSKGNKWAFKVGKSTFIKCYICEKDFDVRAIRREDGFCPSCNNTEINLSDEPYQPILTQLDQTNDK